MSEADVRAQLLEHIPDLENDEKLLSECISICKDYNIKGIDFFWQLESLRFDSLGVVRGKQTFTSAHAQSIKKKLIDDLNAKRAKELKIQKDRTIAQNRDLVMNTLMRKGSSTRPGVKASASNVVFQGAEEETKRKYHYMYEKVSERSEVLAERIDEFGELVREHYNPPEDLGDPCSTSDKNIITVGRICSDADASIASSKLMEGSIFLETSRMIGSGARVPLRFSASLRLRGFSQGVGSAGLFPGAIVALRGRNGGGGSFVVEEILSFPPLLCSPEPTTHKAFTMAMACGPYSSEIDMEYKLFGSLLEKLRSSRPSVLVLLGPFIDAAHPFIKSADIDQTPSEIFKIRFVEPLKAFLKASPETLVILEPSIRDILSDHPVYPQSELDNLDISSIPESRIRLLPNPSRFTINEVAFGSTSVDVLFHLRNQEYAQRGTPCEPLPPVSLESSGSDPLANACRHLLSQRSFYPLFPVPIDMSAEVNLDVSHFDGLRLDPSVRQYAPDVLLLPSKLKQFTKLVDGTWAINPSFLTKGTYAWISVPDTPRTELKQAMRCEIMKL